MTAFEQNLETLTKEGYTVLISQKFNDVEDFYYYIVSIADRNNKVVSIGEGILVEAMTEAYCGTPEAGEQVIAHDQKDGVKN